MTCLLFLKLTLIMSVRKISLSNDVYVSGKTPTLVVILAGAGCVSTALDRCLDAALPDG